MTTGKALEKKRNPEFDRWVGVLKEAAKILDRGHWATADVLAEGERQFGTDALEAGKDVAQLSPQSIRMAIDTANRFPRNQRREGFSFITHARVRVLGDEEEQLEFFQLAEAEGWDDARASHEIALRKLGESKSKTTKELFQLEEVFSFGRKFSKLSDDFEKLPEGQRDMLKDELLALAKRILEWAGGSDE